VATGEEVKTKTALTLIVLAMTLTAAKKDRDWKTGKIMGARTVNTGAVAGQGYPSVSGGHVAPPVLARTLTTAELEIFGADYAYTVRDLGNGGLFRHPCRYIVGDTVKYSQEKGILVLLDADGTECKAQVMVQERLPADVKAELNAPAPPAPAAKP
jgi:hypothetical protein